MLFKLALELIVQVGKATGLQTIEDDSTAFFVSTDEAWPTAVRKIVDSVHCLDENGSVWSLLHQMLDVLILASAWRIGKPLNDAGDVLIEVLDEKAVRNVTILDGIMQKCRSEDVRVALAKLAHELLHSVANPDWMLDIRVAAELSYLTAMSGSGIDVGFDGGQNISQLHLEAFSRLLRPASSSPKARCEYLASELLQTRTDDPEYG